VRGTRGAVGRRGWTARLDGEAGRRGWTARRDGEAGRS
jgi:hypothetical protein